MSPWHVHVWIQPITRNRVSSTRLPHLNNREMDAIPAVSTLHTQGSKAWTGYTKHQEKDREHGGEIQSRSNRNQTTEQKGSRKKIWKEIKQKVKNGSWEWWLEKGKMCLCVCVCVSLCRGRVGCKGKQTFCWWQWLCPVSPTMVLDNKTGSRVSRTCAPISSMTSDPAPCPKHPRSQWEVRILAL